MTVPARQTGEGPQVTWLRYILNQLIKISGIVGKIALNPGLTLTTNQVDAVQNAVSPSITNVFATIADIPIALTKGTYTDINTGTDNSKYITSLAIANSNLLKKIKKDYRVLLTQTGTTTPTPNVLEDDLATPVWSYSSVGTYLLTKAGAFTVNKTLPATIVGYNDVIGNLITLERTSADVMTLKTYAAADTTILANGVLTNQFINIEIYL